MGLNPLVDKVRAAHPGAYDDMDDGVLTEAVLNKYPQYKDLATPVAKVPQPDMQQSFLGTLEAGPTGSGPNETAPSPKGQMAKDTESSPLVGALTVGGAAAVPLAAGGDALAGAGAFEALKAAAPHLETIVKVAKVLGYGSLGLKEILDIGKALGK